MTLIVSLMNLSYQVEINDFDFIIYNLFLYISREESAFSDHLFLIPV